MFCIEFFFQNDFSSPSDFGRAGAHDDVSLSDFNILNVLRYMRTSFARVCLCWRRWRVLRARWNLSGRRVHESGRKFPMRLPQRICTYSVTRHLRGRGRVQPPPERVQQRHVSEHRGLVQVQLLRRVQAEPQQRLHWYAHPRRRHVKGRQWRTEYFQNVSRIRFHQPTRLQMHHTYYNLSKRWSMVLRILTSISHGNWTVSLFL